MSARFAEAQVKTPYITHVAIRYAGKTYSLPKPNRHHHVIRMIGGISGPDIQGFLDDSGVFLNRADALEVALRAGQVLDIDNVRAGRLFSEDLW